MWKRATMQEGIAHMGTCRARHQECMCVQTNTRQKTRFNRGVPQAHRHSHYGATLPGMSSRDFAPNISSTEFDKYLVQICRLLTKDVCKKTYLALVQEGEATHSAQRQAVQPGEDKPFDLQSLKKKRTDLKGIIDPATKQQEDSNADYWAPAELPVTKNEKLFVQVVGEHIIKHFGEALPHRSVINRATKCRRVQVNIPNGLFASRTELLTILKSSDLLPDSFAESTFFYYLRKFYFFVCFQKWTPFSKCDV